MRKVILILFPGLACFILLSGSAGVNAQKQQGYIRYISKTNWVKMMSAVDYLSKEQKDRASYMWGNEAEWKMYCDYYFSDSLTKYTDSEEKADRDYDGYNWRKDEYTVTRDLKLGHMKDIINLLGKVYIVEDTLIFPDWKILNDMKDIEGHVCMNAMWNDTLKKQKIIAWFALDMPVSGGPERLGGLPGLILEADINNGAKVITADRIELKALTTELNLPKKIKGKKINEAAYSKLLKDYFDDRRKMEQPPFWGIRY